MRTVIAIIDTVAFVLFGAPVIVMISLIMAATSLSGKKRRASRKAMTRFSFVVADLISEERSALKEEVLLGDYILRDYSVYLDYNNPFDRFENVDDRIYIHSIAAHPDGGLYKAGFCRVNMLVIELKALFTAFSAIYKARADFVKAHDPHILGLNGLVAGRLFRLPLVLHMNSDFDMKYAGTGRTSSPLFISRSMERLFEAFIMNSCDLIMADRNFYKTSRHFPKRCLGKYNAFGVRVAGRHYSEPSSRKDLKSGLGLEGKKILLYVGRLHPVKYPEDAIKAFSFIKKGLPESALLMVGAGVLRKRLEEMAVKSHIGRDVLFLGARRGDELPDIFYTADLLLAPHGGVTLLEAALASTPMVAYDFDWHPEFVEDARMGYLVPFRDTAKMAERALEILGDEKRMEDMGAYCRKTALAAYSRDASMANERRIYDMLVRR